MKNVCSMAVVVLGLLTAGMVQNAVAARITGEYLEARTCNVYTGPCFANAEMSLTGKEAIMAWKVDSGTWQDEKLDGLGAALVVHAQSTLGYDGTFDMKAGHIQSVIMVDDRATPAQHAALVAFVKDAAKDLTEDVVKVEAVPFKLENNHLDHIGVFKAGDMAEIKTRRLKDSDCVCTNEVVFYQPLTKIDNAAPAYSQKLSWQGENLGLRFVNHGIRSAFLGTFRR